MLNALNVALGEVRRGALRQVAIASNLPTQEPLESMAQAETWPDIVNYRFRCTHCGHNFELYADTYHGGGAWTQEGETDGL
jgi:hypothetical protein